MEGESGYRAVEVRRAEQREAQRALERAIELTAAVRRDNGRNGR